MDEKERVRYYVDVIAATMERTIRRLWVLCIVLCALLAASWGGFLWYLNQYDFESYSYAQDGQGLNIIGDRNGVDFNVPEIDSPKTG